MSEEGKKISFGFSKFAKPKVSIISNSKEAKIEEGVQFIDCVEDKSIKVKNEEPKAPEFLVIPLPKQSSGNVKNSDLLDKILNKSVSDINIKTEEKDDKLPVSNVSTCSEINNKLESLDQIAAREIIEDLKKVADEKEELNNFSVPLTTNAPAGEKESSLDDYEAIPVDKFGFAMLRGMGWVPGKGIGKNEKIVDAKQPVLRPKGLGLGADKVIEKVSTPETVGEPIKLVKGSFVRIIAGAYKNLFGEVIGFDDEGGRLIVKMTIGSSVVTFNEFMVQPVSKEDYNKNSRVINVKKFEEYKSREDATGVIKKESGNDSRKSSNKYSTRDEKSKLKSKGYRNSSVSSNDSVEERKVKTSEMKYKSKARYNSSPENSNDEEIKSRTSKKHSSSRVNSPVLYKSKNYDKHTFKRKNFHSPDRNLYKSYSKHSSHKKIAESNRYKNHRSPSTDDSSPSRSNSKSYDEHISRKEVSKSKKYHSYSSSSSAERCSSSKYKESKRKSKKPSSSSESDHRPVSYRKRREVSPYTKKKSRRSRSSEEDNERSTVHKKHKKHKSKRDR